MGADSCGTCGSPANLICGGCGDVAYCSKDHQKKDWKTGHKANCKAYKIEVHPQFGRYLVTTRDLKPGSRILNKVRPSVLGPPLSMFVDLSCVCCNNKILPNKANVYCPQCNFPICSEQCIHPESDPFCQYLSKITTNQNLEFITPLKFLMLKDSNPELFSKLLERESHAKELKKCARWNEYQGKIIDPLMKLNYFDEDLIVKVIGILATNAFEVQSGPTSNKGLQIGMFEIADIMNHDCIGNTRIVMDTTNNDFKMSVYASVAIPKGSPILNNYVKPLDTTPKRQDCLQDFKFFTCKCPRCLDPTDMKTFNSSYLCTKCQTGPIVCQTAGDVKCWTCVECQNVMEDDSKIKFLDDQITNAGIKLKKIQARLDLVQAKKLFNEMSQYLYPSHGFMQEIKQVLVLCHAAGSNNPGLEKEPLMHKERIKLIDEILESLDILEPGLSLGRGKKILFFRIYYKQLIVMKLFL